MPAVLFPVRTPTVILLINDFYFWLHFVKLLAATLLYAICVDGGEGSLQFIITRLKEWIEQDLRQQRVVSRAQVVEA